MISVLDGWIGGVAGCEVPLDRRCLDAWRLTALNRTISHAAQNSPFHGERLPRGPLAALEELAGLPFTTPGDLSADPLAHLCVSQGEIERVVTLATTGTTGPRKRLFFTAEDLERTIDFFAVGMAPLATPKGRVLVLMPGEKPGSVGELLSRAMGRLGAACESHGLVADPAAALDHAVAFGATCLVGLPVHLLALARQAAVTGRTFELNVNHTLLSGDAAPEWLTRRVSTLLGCEVHRHFGLTETGLGGAVECGAHQGLHLREADLLVEIIDPAGLAPLPPGSEGELVLTTLSRRGMPLIRYRTGDLARLETSRCSCGSAVARLFPLARRLGEGFTLPGGAELTAARVDEAVLSEPEIVVCHSEYDSGGALLSIGLAAPMAGAAEFAELTKRVRRNLARIPGVEEAFGLGLGLDVRAMDATSCLAGTPAKRLLRVRENERSA